MDFNKYKNTMEYPEKPRKPNKPGKDASSGSYREYTILLEDYETLIVQRNEHLAAYKARSVELEHQFWVDALEEVGLTNHPNAKKISELAWNHGHASGLPEVFTWLEEFAIAAKI